MSLYVLSPEIEDRDEVEVANMASLVILETAVLM
jgi:hypothetical protein